MNYPKDRIVAAFVLSVLLPVVAGPTTSLAQESDASSVLRHFLELDCGVGEDGSALKAVVAHREALEPELDRLLREGPDESVLAEVRSRAEQEWKRRESFLDTNPQLGLDTQGRLNVSTRTRDDFVSDALNRTTRRYREKAVVGLAAIGSPSARLTLRDVRSTTPDDDFRAFIASVERRFGPTVRKPDAPRRRIR